MAMFQIKGEAVIPKKIAKNGIIYGFKKYAGRKVKVVVLEEGNKEEE